MVAKPPECLVGRASVACPWRGLWSQNPPSACSKCSRPRWNGGDMGFLGCSGRRFGRAGAWRGIFCGAAREGGASWCVLVTYFCAAAGEVLPRMVRFFCGGIGWVSCARVLVCSCARWDHRPHCRSGSPDAAFPNRRKYSRRRHTRRAVPLGSRVHAAWCCRSLVRPSTRASDEYFKN